jgi:8-oxo-dGTP diphosphatase
MKVRASGILVEDGKICLMKHRRRGLSYYALPGGGVDDYEDVTGALQREWLEETGIAVEQPELMFVCDVIMPGRQRHVLDLVFRVQRSKEPANDPAPSLGEHLDEMVMIDVSELENLTMAPPIQEQITAALKGEREGCHYLGKLWIDIEANVV